MRRFPSPDTPITPGTSTGITAHAFVISRVTALVLSGLVTSWVGCARSSAWLPTAATTMVPRCIAKRIARRSAVQIARDGVVLAVEQPRVREVAVVRDLDVVGAGPHECAHHCLGEEEAGGVAGLDR